jgi:putative endonuclease
MPVNPELQPVNRPLGISGEALAEDHLRSLGYEIVGRDVRTPLGQLDLVAVDGQTLVFVEVKTRAEHGFGLPQESVDARKIRKLRQLGLYYLKIRPHRGPVRFDVVGLTVIGGKLTRVDHVKNAID